MKLYPHLLVLVMMLSLHAMAESSPLSGSGSSSGPGDGGGGGSVVKLNAQAPWILLDRLTVHPNFAPSASASKETHSRVQPSKDQPKLVPLSKEDLAAFDRADEILDRWTESSPTLIRVLKQVLRRMPYLKTSSSIAVLPRYVLPESLKKSQPAPEIKTAILYLPKYGSIISEEIWNDPSMDRDTQAGLLIHEALRQIQGGYGNSSVTDLVLQKITGTIMDGDPKTQNLETGGFLTSDLDYLYRVLKASVKPRAEFDAYRNWVCKNLGSSALAAEVSKGDPCVMPASDGVVDRSNEKSVADVIAILNGEKPQAYSFSKMSPLVSQACANEGPSDAGAWLDSLRNELVLCVLSDPVPSDVRSKCRDAVARRPNMNSYALLNVHELESRIEKAIDDSQKNRRSQVLSGAEAFSSKDQKAFQDFWNELVKKGILKP